MSAVGILPAYASKSASNESRVLPENGLSPPNDFRCSPDKNRNPPEMTDDLGILPDLRNRTEDFGGCPSRFGSRSPSEKRIKCSPEVMRSPSECFYERSAEDSRSPTIGNAFMRSPTMDHFLSPRELVVKRPRYSPAKVSPDFPDKSESEYRSLAVPKISSGRLSPSQYSTPENLTPATEIRHPATNSKLQRPNSSSNSKAGACGSSPRPLHNKVPQQQQQQQHHHHQQLFHQRNEIAKRSTQP